MLTKLSRCMAFVKRIKIDKGELCRFDKTTIEKTSRTENILSDKEITKRIQIFKRLLRKGKTYLENLEVQDERRLRRKAELV